MEHAGIFLYIFFLSQGKEASGIVMSHFVGSVLMHLENIWRPAATKAFIVL